MATEVQLFTTLDALVERTDTLVALTKSYQDRIAETETEIEALRGTVREQQKQIRELQKKKTSGTGIVDKSVSFSKIVSDKLAETADAAEIKQKLDDYIGHIDRCIAQLSNLS